MAKPEYRMVPLNGRLVPAALRPPANWVVVSRGGGAMPFVISKREWDAAPITENADG